MNTINFSRYFGIKKICFFLNMKTVIFFTFGMFLEQNTTF